MDHKDSRYRSSKVQVLGCVGLQDSAAHVENGSCRTDGKVTQAEWSAVSSSSR